MALEVGDPAPDFSLRDQHGGRVALSSLRGRPVLLVFFPFAFSGVCTGELLALRDEAAAVDALGASVLAVSCDPMFALRVQADRDGLDFPLLSDFWPHGEVATAYGAFDPERGCPTRSTFLVDGDGLLQWSVHNPLGEARALGDALEAIDRLTRPAHSK